MFLTWIESVFLLKATSLLYVSLNGPLPIVKSAIIFCKSPSCLFSYIFASKQNGITEITFDIDFEIKNKFLNSLMIVSFQFGLEKIADAFQKRAEELFGKTKD